jgi:hypothetical protein
MTTTVRRQHAGICANPDGHMLVGSPDDGSDRKEDWCRGRVCERDGFAIQYVDSPAGIVVRLMPERTVITVESWRAIIRESAADADRYLPGPRQASGGS